MKAFKKWAGPGFNWGSDPLNRPGLDQARRGWRGALEEVLKQIDTSAPELIDTINSVSNVVDWIKKELGE